MGIISEKANECCLDLSPLKHHHAHQALKEKEIQKNWVDNLLSPPHPAHSFQELQSAQKYPPSSEVEFEYQGKH